MELTKSERQTILYALGLAIEKETAAVAKLKTEVRAEGITRAIVERSQHVKALDRLRERLQNEN